MTDKEKYEQALMIAKETYDKQPMYRAWLEKMFPELAESEDERIRKLLIDFFRDWRENRSHCWGIAVSKILAWLEKQGKPSDEEMKTLLRTEYEKGRADAIAEMQKDWSEEDEIYYKRVQLSIEWARAHNRISEGSCDEQLNWLKSLKDRVQPKPEWSEEDSYYRNHIIQIIEEINNAPLKRGEDWEAYINWLKSLRPKNRWEPTDEQMKALNYVVNLMASSESPKENDYYYNVFKDLRKQLKKLKEGKV